jgi:hypothetical protein
MTDNGTPLMTVEILNAQSFTIYYGESGTEKIVLNPGHNDFFSEDKAEALINHPTLATFESCGILKLSDYRSGKVFEHDATGLTSTIGANGEETPISVVNSATGVAEVQRTGKQPKGMRKVGEAAPAVDDNVDLDKLLADAEAAGA